ncbi:hypothetical protein CQW23_02664 [Capsicum baccatum]|uniref:Uncharacterized protein n=1 Tax=Capsicum baccatum TaxID=33114 RepID=A0A2G2XSG0_CAPBA|nr:hypothetical protein CQW23_02664 [Capsicum baccatum]
MMCLGMPQSLTTSLRNNRVASLALQLDVAAENVAYLEKRSMTTMIVPQHSDLGKHVIKSMVTLSHSFSATGSGSSNPPGALCSTLSCWQTRQVQTYTYMQGNNQASTKRIIGPRQRKEGHECRLL